MTFFFFSFDAEEGCRQKSRITRLVFCVRFSPLSLPRISFSISETDIPIFRFCSALSFHIPFLIWSQLCLKALLLQVHLQQGITILSGCLYWIATIDNLFPVFLDGDLFRGKVGESNKTTLNSTQPFLILLLIPDKVGFF